MRGRTARPARPRIVALRALGIGDFLTGVPALRALRNAYVDHRLVLAAPRLLQPLVDLSGAVDEVSHTPGLVPLTRDLARPDLAVDLHGRGPASHDLLVDLTPRRLVAFAHHGTPSTEGGPCWRADEHEVARWCRLLEESGIPTDPSLLDLSPPLGPRPPWALGATLVHPGAAAEARRWPAPRFAAVVAAELAAGRKVVVTASPSERYLASRVASDALARAARSGAAGTGQIRTAVPADLGELAVLVTCAGRVVCGDTGVAHLATALRTPSVVLFGPVPPSWWGPPPERWWHVALWAGRCGDPHGEVVDAGLLEIGAADVLLALARLPDDDTVRRAAHAASSR